MLNFATVMLGVLFLMVARTTSHLGSGPHITDVNILLPPKMTYPVEYRLQGSDGCFKWSWDHHDILSVLPEYNVSSQCSTSALLRSISPYSGRKETAVYAADKLTGIVIRCKVFIDNISRIQIFHNSIKLDLDGLATLRVRAFDSEDNVFSSLVGLRFMWQLMPQADGLPHHIVHLPLKDSPLGGCGRLCGDLDTQIKLEESGVFADLFVVRGIEIGHETVAVKLLEKQHNQLADKIVLTVAEAMSLDPPSPVLVLIGATVNYSLKIIRGNVPQGITLPSPHYRWSISNSSVAEVDLAMGLTYALNLGVTTVIVEDTRVSGHIQMSSLSVVVPDSLYLFVSPLTATNDPVEGAETISSSSPWFVVSGRQYIVQMKVFSQGLGAQEIYITKSDDVKWNDDLSESWRTYLVPDDTVAKLGRHNSRFLKATSEGRGQLTASLTYFTGHLELKEVFNVVQEIIVCDQVKFILHKASGVSQSILLPWAPSVYQEVELRAAGGCAEASSDYKWVSSDTTVVSVSTSGIVQAKKPGRATVKVLSSFDSSNYDEVAIEVSVPSSMLMIPNFPVETVVRSHLLAAVTMKAPNGAYFYRCDVFNSLIKWKAGSESFVIVNTTRETLNLDMRGNIHLHGSVYGPACSWTSVYAFGYGQAMIHATLSKENNLFDYGPIVLKASSRIAAYPPLIVSQASDGNQFGGYWLDLAQAEADNSLENLNKLYLVPGSLLNIMLYGGPEQWEKGVDFVETVEILNQEHALVNDGVLLQRASGSHRSLYRVLCQAQGTFKLVFRRGNMVGDDHPLPEIAEVSLSVICSIPSSIALIADESVNGLDVIRTAIQAEHSSGRIQVTPITVANGRIIRIAAVGISNSGEAFTNSSSLSLRWELSHCNGLAYWDDVRDSERSKFSWERFLSLRNESGLCIVRATVSGFLDAISDSYSALLSKVSKNDLTDAIRLQLVSTLRVDPEFNLLFFSPAAKGNLSITGGSCFLEAVANDSQVVEVIQPSPGLQCSNMLLSPKRLGTTLVTIYDIGLTPPLAASAVVQVADIDWIRITSQEEISLMEESSQIITLMAGIEGGNTFDSSQFAYMHIHVHIEDHIVEIVDTDGISGSGNQYIKASRFEIKAKKLGITTLYVSALQQSGHEIVSQTVTVEVYAPPSIYPSDIFLVPGSSYVLTVKGGPTIAVYVEYDVRENEIAIIHKSSGKLSALSPGNCTIHAKIFGEGDSVICEAYGKVRVGVPSTAMLNVQSKQLGIGREMPIYPLFPKGDLLSFYELCRNYHWTVEDEKVLSFRMLEHLTSEKHGAPHSAATQYMNEKELGFINVLYGRSAGKTNVTVSFSCEFMSPGSKAQTRFYHAFVSLLVVPDLPLALGIPVTWILPPHYITRSTLPSSIEVYDKWNAQGRKGNIFYSLLRNTGKRNEVFPKDEISIDGDRIKTTESDNIGCIQAKDLASGRIEIAACIRVAEVSQIRITSQEFEFHVINLAVGAELDLPISYFDSRGNLFYEASNIVPVSETNHRDVVSLNYTTEGSGYIHVKANKHGSALVRLSMDNNLEKSDYMLISVGANLHPQNPVLHVGSTLKFGVEGLDDQISGKWFTGNKNIISVDMLSGNAEAVGEGTTQVFFEGSDLKLQTTVTAITKELSVDSPVEMLTNVPFPTKGYNFSVKFRSKFGVLENDKAEPYTCIVEPAFVGYAKAWFDSSNNNSYCLFFPYSPGQLAQVMPKSKGMRPDVSVSIYASRRESNEVSGSAMAIFVGGFSVMEMEKLNLTPDSNKTVITILGNTDVEINWHNRDLKVIGPIYREDFGIGGRAQYEVKAGGTNPFKDQIIITLPANSQRVELDVSYEPEQRAAPKTSKYLWTILGLLPFVVLIGIFILERWRRSQPFTSPTTTIYAPLTPDRRSSPGALTDQSPRTPKPYVDYVRRTIDETPYYRREGRRFNPQNTY